MCNCSAGGDTGVKTGHLTENQIMDQDARYCTVLYCTVLYCTVLYYTVLYCTVLYCIRLTQRVVQGPGPVGWSARLPLLVREAQGGVIPVALSVDRQVDI